MFALFVLLSIIALFAILALVAYSNHQTTVVMNHRQMERDALAASSIQTQF